MSSWLSADTIGVQTFLPEALYYPQAMLNIRLPTVWITLGAIKPTLPYLRVGRDLKMQTSSSSQNFEVFQSR